MGLTILLLALAAATAIGFALFWRREQILRAEIAALRQSMSALEARSASVQRRAQRGEVGRVSPAMTPALTPTLNREPALADAPAAETPMLRASRLWRAPLQTDPRASPISADTWRGAGLALSALAPAFVLFFGLEASTSVACGLLIASGHLLLSLRRNWAAAAPTGVMAVALWGALGLVLGAAQAATIPFSAALVFVGGSAVAHAHLRRGWPAHAAALLAAAFALALATQTQIVGAAGVAFGLIVAAAAIAGSLSLRLESMHLAAFGAALVGLFVLSGQGDAAIWFTPIATWTAALFLGIAIIRVPGLGPRGVALAGTGALTPLGVIAALHLARHGLAETWAAAAAFVALAIVLALLLAASATRLGRGLDALKLTLWVLALAAGAALAGAAAIALPAPVAAPTLMLLALGAVGLDQRFPNAAWRVCASGAALLAGIETLLSAELVLAEARHWNGWAILGLGFAAVSLIAALAARFAHANKTAFTAALLEAVTIGAAVAGANLALRLAVSNGAMILTPISFAELGGHISIWLLAALIAGAGSRGGATHVRLATSLGLGAWALSLSALAGVLWFTPYWSAREVDASTLLANAPLGFIAPAIMFWAHWVFWRARASQVRTRLALGAGALMLAGFVTLSVVRAEDMANWARALASALGFALAILINFAPGVTASQPSSDLGDDFHRHRAARQAR